MAKSKPTIARPFFLFLRNNPMKHSRKPMPQRAIPTILTNGIHDIIKPINDRINPAMAQPFFPFVVTKLSPMFSSLSTCRAQLLIVNYDKTKIVIFF